jgi:hypothetical protein
LEAAGGYRSPTTGILSKIDLESSESALDKSTPAAFSFMSSQEHRWWGQLNVGSTVGPSQPYNWLPFAWLAHRFVV